MGKFIGIDEILQGGTPNRPTHSTPEEGKKGEVLARTSLLLSVMLLLQLLQPVLTMFGGGDGWNAEEQVTGFMQELQTVLTRASEQAEQSQEEIGNTAAAVAQEAGEGYDPANVWEQDSAQGAVTGENSGEVSDQKETDRENAETEGIHVDIAPIRLE